MSRWFRTYEEMLNDPKWRLIAKRSGAAISEVITVALGMMTRASASSSEHIKGWSDDVMAACIDVETDVVTNIRTAMQGVFLDGETIRAWEQRQDYSTPRVTAWRERQAAAKANLPAVIPPSAPPAVKPLEAEKSKKTASKQNRSRLPDDAKPSEKDIAAGKEMGLSEAEIAFEWDRFCNHHGAEGSLMLRWDLAWRKWLSNKHRFEPKALPGTLMADDHQPNDRDKATAVEYGLTPQDFREEWRAFRNHHHAKGSRKADWSAAWRAWLDDRKRGLFSSKPAPQGHESNFTKAARRLLGELENAESSDGETTGIASTLPDAAFAPASDPLLVGQIRDDGSSPIIDLEPTCAGYADAGAPA